MKSINFLIFIVLFFSKIFIVKCETRKVRLYLFFNRSLYRYFSEKNQAYKDFQSINDINELNTDYVIKDFCNLHLNNNNKKHKRLRGTKLSLDLPSQSAKRLLLKK